MATFKKQERMNTFYDRQKRKEGIAEIKKKKVQIMFLTRVGKE